MSRILLSLLLSAFLIFPAACSAIPEELPEQNTTRNRILTVYFSCTGTTKAIAEKIASITGSDIYSITPEEPYTEKDLAYYTGGRADQEQADPSVRPLISGNAEDMDGYDTIILGYPIWHGEAPRIINTFLESYDFSGKTILPFCTSHSSGIGSSDDRLHPSAPSATWLSGVRFPSGASDDEIRAWLESEGISMNKRREFNFDTHTVMLNSGYEMPIMGLGTYSLSDEECYNSVTALLEAGGRLIDTAYMYHNEAAVGRAIRDSDVPREEIFVITKLYPNQFANAEEAIDEALEKLDGADEFFNLLNKVKEAAAGTRTSVKEKEEEQSAPSFSVRLFSFSTLDGVIQAARLIAPAYKGANTLYKDGTEDIFLLALAPSEHSTNEFNKICNMLSEYGTPEKADSTVLAFLEEHCDVIISADAVQKLSTL